MSDDRRELSGKVAIVTGSARNIGRATAEELARAGAAVSLAANASIPLGRKGVPQDLAALVRFVVGPNATYISGESIHCNGGAYMNL